MKRIAIFIGLKVLEVGGVVFVLWGLGILGKMLLPSFFGVGSSTECPVWVAGIVSAGGLFAVVILVCLACSIVKANWRKAGEIAERGEG
jgi:hypothetical protein